jgi:hypothetical protein
MSLSTRRAVIGPLDGEAGDERSRIDADVELSIGRAVDGGVTLRQETTQTPNFEKVIESSLSRAEAVALRDQLDAMLAEG